MKFEDVIGKIPNITDLRRAARAHVVDHKQLSNEQLAGALLKSMPQYVHQETIEKEVLELLRREPRGDLRTLAYIFLFDVLLEQYDTQAPLEEVDEKVIAFELSIVDRSNETDLATMACGDKSTKRYQDLELYKFILSVAWEQQDSVSPDEANLLAKLRERLKINETEHRILEAHLGRHPRRNNEPHTRADVAEIRRRLQELGIVFPIRSGDGVDRDIVPEEIAKVLRGMFGVGLRRESYRELLDHRALKKKPHLVEVLEGNEVTFGRYDTMEQMRERIVANVPAARAIACASPRYGLNSDELSELCKDLSLPVSGSMQERIDRIVAHYENLRPRVAAEGDERELWYRHFEDLALRNHATLRAQHIIEKDLECEHKFEEATRYLFDKLLGHTPLKQTGSNHCDGLLSLKNAYLMWDNKSKERYVNLKDHINQFDGYMDASEKPVPIFMVIAPSFTEESEVEATRYHAQHFDRNIVLITAGELKSLADEWTSRENKNREQPFPLGFFAASGRFNRKRLGDLF
jgi:hypothetical protein